MMLVRPDLLVEMTPDGQLINIKRADIHSTQNVSLWGRARDRLRVDTEEASYYIKNDMGLLNAVCPTYSLLIKSASDGTETALYNIHSLQLRRMIFIVAGIGSFFAFVMLCIVRSALQRSRK